MKKLTRSAIRNDHLRNIVFEWIPYNQFSDIKEIGRGGFATVYSAIWKDGPLEWNYVDRYTRKSNKKVALKCLHNSQDITAEFLREVSSFSFKEVEAVKQ